jgi:hypothetical protein
MARNYWLEHVVDAYLRACAAGADWKIACAEAERTHTGPVRALTREDLATVKGVQFSRQHVDRKVRDGMFPPPFQTPSLPRPRSSKPPQRKRQRRKRSGAGAELPPSPEAA